ncbi:hypothetical protein VN97_g2604 [Penicillium thymicola]|uniref:Uncharacterized protein n=1 Tax=Penicillium thymicola TaxID=293382 RepID=A0AAI9TNS4_PENTH|nr:hypothetical protein VN97_g2604 [Penicillium thymicola]
MGFHYAANGAKVCPIHRNIYRQVSIYIQIILGNLVQQWNLQTTALKGTHGFKLIPSVCTPNLGNRLEPHGVTSDLDASELLNS